MLSCASVLRADVTGSIQGVVRDRSQGAIAGAQLTITNVDTNLQYKATAGADGSYRILALPPGNYKLTVTAAGFRTFSESDIVVKVNDQLQIDATLDVGSAQQEVINVEANAVQVQTESTQLGDVIDSKKMLALPLNGRSYIDLLGLQAGVAPSTAGTIGGDRPVSGNLSAGNISVNGQRETANAFLVNGGDVSEGRNLGAGLIPNLDSVEEFRLITNSFDAEYGKFSGAVMNAITKSGTNSFHGDVFEFLRNDALDARNYFAPSKSELRQNQFGYTLGGPVWKNHLFFFSDYQGTRQVQGAETGLVTVPTTAERAGNFDPSTLSGTIDGPYWAQVLSQRLGYTVTQGEPYSAVGCTSTAQCVFPGGVIPQSAWAAPATHILPYIPEPTLSGDVNNYSNNSQRSSITDNKFGERVDFNNQTTGNWSWYYHIDNTTVDSALAGFATVPGFPTNTPSRAQEFVMSNTKTFGATAVNEARISFFRTAVHKDNPAGSFADLSSLGFVTGADTLGIAPLPGYPQYMPQVTLAQIGMNIGVPTLNTFQPDTTYAASDVFSKVTGKHTWKFGGEFRYIMVNERNYASPNGQFTFDGSVTGSDMADYPSRRHMQYLRGCLRPGFQTGAGFPNALWRSLRPGLLESEIQPHPQSWAPVGSEHAVVRLAREDRRPGFQVNSPRCFRSLPKVWSSRVTPAFPIRSRRRDTTISPLDWGWRIRRDFRTESWAKYLAARANPAFGRPTASTTLPWKTSPCSTR